ncbi:MAG TPA: RDD family protein [Anaeromyxobacteraceae bacterium]|nr:RDD family protein [Anaeromyxobacteraceae bacterium]
MTAAETPAQQQAPHERPARLGEWSDRAIAAIVDGGMLLLLGIATGLGAGAYLPPAGWTKLVGLALGVAYLGIGGSKLTGGQTAGMSIARLALVGAGGRPLSVVPSMLRATVLIAPWCLSALYVGAAQIPTSPVLDWASRLLTFGVAPVSLLMLLTRPRRGQFFHDVLVGSFLVLEDDVGRDTPPVLGPRALLVPAICLFGVGAAHLPSFFRAEVQEQTQISSRLRTLPGVAGVQFAGSLKGDGERHLVVFLGVWADAPPCAEVLRGAAEAIEEEEPRSGRVDLLTLACIRGWNDGLLHWLSVDVVRRGRTAMSPTSGCLHGGRCLSHGRPRGLHRSPDLSSLHPPREGFRSRACTSPGTAGTPAGARASDLAAKPSEMAARWRSR